jgi:sulfopyruvate decarboxylase subunit beta
VRSVEDFKQAISDAMHGNELTSIIAKVDAKGPSAFVTDLTLLENRFQFRRHIQSLKRI